MPSKTEKLLSLLNGQPVIPVLKIADVKDAVPCWQLARLEAEPGVWRDASTPRLRRPLPQPVSI